MRASLSSVNRRRLAGPLAVLALAMVAFSVLVLTGGTAHGSSTAVSTDAADISAGGQLFAAHCQSCHGAAGVGGSNGSPELVDSGAAATDFYLSTGRMPLNNPNDEAIRHRPYFNDTQIRQLVAYVNALPEITGSSTSGQGIPDILPACPTGKPSSPDCVSLAEGQEIYGLNCAQCHHSGAAGGMLSKGNTVPSLSDSSLLQIAEAPRVGPKPMPVFGTNQLSDRQVSAIAHYVQYLKQHGSHGGLAVSHFGPVAEGFVGIVIGLGLLLLASRLIGTRG